MGKSYIESFLSKAPWANVLERTGGFPLDRSSMFDSFEDAEKYAKGEKTNPDKRGLYGNSKNAMSLANTYYQNALYFIDKNDYKNGMAYFGAMCHLIQDVTIPQHAKRKLLDNHKPFETYVKSNYKIVKKFKTKGSPLLYKNVSDYVEYNSRSALNFDYMYRDINNSRAKFYLIAIDALYLSQRSTSGCMLMFYENLEKMKKNAN